MFNPALEYRKYIQKPRTPQEKDQKLIRLALKEKKVCKLNVPYQEIVREIARSFNAGEDILDPSIFSRESIIEFAKEHEIENDRMVREFIDRAQPEASFAIHL